MRMRGSMRMQVRGGTRLPAVARAAMCAHQTTHMRMCACRYEGDMQYEAGALLLRDCADARITSNEPTNPAAGWMHVSATL